ncbi:MAG: hypothetical protein JNJ54_30015 [Myxococcaceae bacterium]|nr:hypothetical protein [Myxococcaceae bacterium]
MRRLSLLLTVLIAVNAFAEPPQRTFLSAVGVGVAGLGLGLAGFGLGQQLIASDARAVMKAYGIPTAAEAPAVSILQKRADSAGTLALVGFLGGAALLAGGIVLVLLDSPAAPVTAFVTPLPGGAAAGVTATF